MPQIFESLSHHLPARALRIAACLLLAAGCAVAPRAHAEDAPKTNPDSIVFANGDQLTGKLVRFAGGNVTFHSDIVGDVSVPWDKIKEIHSSTKFVVLEKGIKLNKQTRGSGLPTGNVALNDKKWEVQTDSGSVTATLPAEKVDYVVDQPTFEKEMYHEPGFLHAWNGTVTAGATIVQATQNTYTFNGAVALVRQIPTVTWLDPRNRTSVDFIGSYGKITEPGTPSVKTAIYHADAERDQYFSPRLYALAAVAFDHNFSQSLDLQQIYGGGIGWTIIKQEKQTLDIKALMQYEKQAFLNATSGTNQNLIGSTFSASYVRKLPKNILFTQQVSYIPAWNNLHAYSANETNTLALPVYKRFSLAIGTIDSYLNNPANTAPPTKRNSFQFTMGVTYNLQ